MELQGENTEGEDCPPNIPLLPALHPSADYFLPGAEGFPTAHIPR